MAKPNKHMTVDEKLLKAFKMDKPTHWSEVRSNNANKQVNFKLVASKRAKDTTVRLSPKKK